MLNSRKAARVLLVDDEIAQASALAEILCQSGVIAEFATSGAEALRQIHSHAPDLLVVDSRMPDMTAAELIARARDGQDDLAAVLLTGYPADALALADAMVAARGAYLAKPVDVSALLALIASAALAREPPTTC
jgi:CheY-like chemotaxis protein